MKTVQNLVGQRFGRLIVLEHKGKIGKYHLWHCICDCGKELDVSAALLRGGKKKSCGCLRRDSAKIQIERNRKTENNAINAVLGGIASSKVCTTHGDTKRGKRTKLYSRWATIKRRCYNQNCEGYKFYGALGIRMCDEWLNDYSQFKIWALANGYSETEEWQNMTIDRINPYGNYEPSNCRWVDMKIQANNRRNGKNDRRSCTR